MQRLEDSPFVKEAGSLWEEGTRSPFLDAIASGNLPTEAFDRWLSQDYRFARGLVVFQAIAVARCPRRHHGPLIAGLGALESELRWFETHAGKRKLDLHGTVHPVCRRYTDFLIRTAYTERPPVLLATLFGVEAAYFAAWSALEATGPYEEFIDRWSNLKFGEYVSSLREPAEAARDDRAQEFFNQVLIHENDFWTMSWGEE